MSDPFQTHKGSIPRSFRDILEKESFGHVATINPNGTVHNTPVWTDHDGGDAVLINTLKGRHKERNLRRNPNITISITDPENPYRYLAVRGQATLSKDGAADHIDKLANQYLDAETYPHHDEEEAPRILVRIPADHVVTRGRSQDR